MEVAFILVSESDLPWTFVHVLSDWVVVNTRAIRATLQCHIVWEVGQAAPLDCQAVQIWLIMNLNWKLRERGRERQPYNSSENTSLSVCMKAQKQSLDKKLIDCNTKKDLKAGKGYGLVCTSSQTLSTLWSKEMSAQTLGNVWLALTLFLMAKLKWPLVRREQLAGVKV